MTKKKSRGTVSVPLGNGKYKIYSWEAYHRRERIVKAWRKFLTFLGLRNRPKDVRLFKMISKAVGLSPEFSESKEYIEWCSREGASLVERLDI